MIPPRRLTPKIEAWLRERMPAWGSLRDRAIDAGLVEDIRQREILDEQGRKAREISEVAERVRRRLQGAANVH